MNHVRILKIRKSIFKKDFKKSLSEKRVENWKDKQLYEQFISDMPEDTAK